MSLMLLLRAVFCILNQTRTKESFGDAEVTFGIHGKSPQSSSQKFYSYLCFLRYVCFLPVSPFWLATFCLAGNPQKNWTRSKLFVHSTLFVCTYYLWFFQIFLSYEFHCHVATGIKNYDGQFNGPMVWRSNSQLICLCACQNFGSLQDVLATAARLPINML